MESIGPRLYEYRKLRGMSRSKLAKNICDKSTLYRIEKGLQEPQLFTLTQLCLKLDISINDILNPLSREDIKYISYTKHLCRKYVYDQDYSKLECLIEKAKKDISQKNIKDADFLRFIQ